MGGLWHPNVEFTGLGLCHLDLCQRGTPSDIASPMVQGKIPRISKRPQSGDTRDLVGGSPLGATQRRIMSLKHAPKANHFLPRGRIKSDDSEEYQTPSEEGDQIQRHSDISFSIFIERLFY